MLNLIIIIVAAIVFWQFFKLSWYMLRRFFSKTTSVVGCIILLCVAPEAFLVLAFAEWIARLMAKAALADQLYTQQRQYPVPRDVN